MFEKASRLKLRFKSVNGLVSVEDLWDVPLTHLDSIAKALRKELRENEESFISETKKNTTNELAFEIVKQVIEVRLAEKEEKKAAAEKAAKKQRLLEILENKQNASLENLTEEQLRAEIEKL